MDTNRKTKGHDELSRRRFVAIMGGGALITATGIVIGINSNPGEVLRPPGAVEEKFFLALCTRCGRCVKVCPTSALSLSGPCNGLPNLMTPVLVPSRGCCMMPVDGCRRCIEACPTKVLQSLPIDEIKAKDLAQVFKIGSAILDTSICVPYAQKQDCVACMEVCPVEGAIQATTGEGKRPGERITKPLFDPDRCVGCGACEYVCVTRPTLGRPAVTITPSGAKKTKYQG